MSATSTFHPASALLVAPRRWLATLKFKIVLLAVLTGVLAAVGTAAVVVARTQASIEAMVLSAAVEDRERSASLLGSKVSTLREALAAVARHTPPGAWADPAAMGRYLLDKPALATMFDSVFGARTDGRLLARVEGGTPATMLPDISDRSYFRQALASDQPVMSEALQGRVAKAPIVVLSVPVLSPDGRHLGVLGGSITLRSTALFQETQAAAHDLGANDLVVDRAGRLLAHRDPDRVLQSARDEPGLRPVLDDWLASGSPIDTRGVATVQGDWVVSVAGIPLTDWITVRLTPTRTAFAPVSEARAAAWHAAVAAGMLAGLLAGGLGYGMTLPISRLRARAEGLLGGNAGVMHWPSDASEVGELASAFRHVVEQRERQQTEVQALLQQLEAVLDHTEVGIALTRNGRFELVSQHFCHIFRCDKPDAVGQSTRMIYPSDEAFAALVEQARPALSEQGVFDAELQLVRRSGQVFWGRMRGRAVVAGDVAQGTIWTIEDVTAAREQREQMAYSASHDALTGLCNRAAFERLLDGAAAAGDTAPFCALFIDLDRFKQVNDTGGHAAGDALLRDVAQVLQQHVRRSDVVARLGGDEFAVLLPDCPAGQAHGIAVKLCAAVQAYELAWEGARFAVGASVGLVAVGAGFASAADVLRAADSACYEAKRRGRNRVEVFQPVHHLALDPH
ncbi:diguanylate cyclase [Rubrivivax sp. RP6-9]|uniref:sensor domain-containing diguanylate cyclase n=1 Tax=Rubrivivax sp. RP6-9 TaxID=3415750 RepID=UPI003CC63085